MYSVGFYLCKMAHNIHLCVYMCIWTYRNFSRSKCTPFDNDYLKRKSEIKGDRVEVRGLLLTILWSLLKFLKFQTLLHLIIKGQFKSES